MDFIYLQIIGEKLKKMYILFVYNISNKNAKSIFQLLLLKNY